MKRVYVVIGELEDGRADVYYAVCHTMGRADELCHEAEAADPEHYYTWYEVIEEDD